MERFRNPRDLDIFFFQLQKLRCPKVLALCVLMVLWTPTLSRPEEPWQMLEYFAGRGNLSRCMRASGYRTASFDILYCAKETGRKEPYNSNCMDMTNGSGYALCIHGLMCTAASFLAHFALKCSSFTPVNQGTSGRTAFTSIGLESQPSVQISNCLGSRTCFLALITTALGGTWVLEQPRGSVYDFFPPFQSLLAVLYEVHGASAVTRCKWYMLHYTSPSPKPHFAYSNSAAVSQLNMGKLVNWKKQKASAVKGGYHIQTCETYYDASGRKRFKGTKQLRRTEEYPVRFGFKMVDLFPDLTTTNRGQASVPVQLPSAIQSYLAMPDFTQGMEFAHLENVFSYLRRGKHLKIPPEWRHLIPKPDATFGK